MGNFTEWLDPKFLKDRLDAFSFSGDKLKTQIAGGTIVANEIGTIKSGTLNVVQEVQKVLDIKGGTIDQVSDILNSVTVDATDLDIRDLGASDTPGRSWNLDGSDVIGNVQNIDGGTIDQVTDILNTVTVDATDLDIRDLGASDTPGRSWNLSGSDVIGTIQDIEGGTIDVIGEIKPGTNRIGGVRILDEADNNFDSVQQDVAGNTLYNMGVVGSGSPGDLTRQPTHDNIVAGTSQSSISYANGRKYVAVVNKGGNDAIVRLNSSTGGTIEVPENVGKVLPYNDISTLYYKVSSGGSATLRVEGWS